MVVNELFDEVHVKFNVLAALMLNWIFAKLNGTLIITLKCSRMLLLKTKL